MQILVIGILALLVPAQSPASEVARHQGVWQVESFLRDGKETDPAIARSITRTVEGDHVVWKRDGKSFAGTGLVLDPSAKPAAIDVIPDGGKSRGDRVLGIYKYEGDELWICMADPGDPRPRAFASPAGSRHTLMRFRRPK